MHVPGGVPVAPPTAMLMNDDRAYFRNAIGDIHAIMLGRNAFARLNHLIVEVGGGVHRMALRGKHHR